MNYIRILSIIFALSSTLQSQAASISFETAPANLVISDIFTLDILGTNFPSTNGGGININYDSQVLNIVGINIDSSTWNFVNSTGTVDNTLGNATDILVSVFPELSLSDFVVASIEFEVVGSGFSDLIMTESSTNPWASDGLMISPDFINSSVNTSAVPLPAALWLFVSGLAILVLKSRP